MNFIVGLDMFPFDILVSIGESDKEFKKTLKKYDIPWDVYFEKERRGTCVQNPDGSIILRVWEKDLTSPMFYDTLSHEIFHAVSLILDYAGIKFSIKYSDEVYAYSIGLVTRKIMEKLL